MWGNTLTDVTAFPYAMNKDQATAFAWGWIEANKPKGGQPDHDGDNDKGWHIFVDGWGHADSRWQGFCSIEIIWAMYGK